MSLKELVAMSNKYGSNPEFVLAGGGNSSYKEDTTLFIKSSGRSMSDIDESGFVRMNRPKLKEVWDKEYSGVIAEKEKQVLADIMKAREKGEHMKRPSVEVLLHDLFPRKFVLHVHPPLINGITCAKNGENAVKSIFKERAIWIPAANPGYTLASVSRKIMDQYRQKCGDAPNLMFIENHGVFFAFDSIIGMYDLIDYVTQSVLKQVIRKPDFTGVEYDIKREDAISSFIRELLKPSDDCIAVFRSNAEIRRLVASRESFIPVSSAYTPDHIVYCRHEPLFVDEYIDMDEQYAAIEKGVSEYEKRNSHKPKIVAVEKLGYFACGSTQKEADIAAEVFLDAIKISVYSESFGGHKFMDDEAIDFIRHWEAESYRQKVSL